MHLRIKPFLCYTLTMKEKLSPPKGMFFDMDGVLLITTQRSYQSWQIVCQHFAPQLGLPVQHLAEALSESRDSYWKEIASDEQKQRRDRLEPFETRREVVARALEQVGKANLSLASEIVRAYEAVREEYRQLAPFAQHTLQQLQDQGIRLALISNGNATYQRRKIEQHHLAPFFQCILIEEEFGAAKPDPRLFLTALKQLDLTPQEVWMIGDDLTFDIAASQRLGIVAIWCDLAQRGLPERHPVHPDRIIHALPELFDLLGAAGRSM